MWDGIDRRAKDRRATSRTLEGRIDAHAGRIHALERDMAGVKVILDDRLEKIDEALDIVTAAKGGFTVITWIGKGAKPVLWIVAAIGGIFGIKQLPWM
jgi:hypothetical protein